MIFTCNFANWTKMLGSVYPISIARFPPRGWKGAAYPPLFPPDSLIKYYKSGKINDIEYRTLYQEMVLDKLAPAKVVTELYDMYDNEEYASCVLLCYENANKFCHRHLVTEWLKDANFYVVEYDFMPKPLPIKPLPFRSKT